MCVFDMNVMQNSFQSSQQNGVDLVDNIRNKEMFLKGKNCQNDCRETKGKDLDSDRDVEVEVEVEEESGMKNTLFSLAKHLHTIVNRKVRNVSMILLLSIG